MRPSANPKPGFDRSGEPVLFHRAGQFPHANDPEYEVDPDARAHYKSGELPVLLRAVGPLNASMGIPFWVTAFAFLNATKIILLAIPILSIAIPLSRFLPLLYTWMIRQRLLQMVRPAQGAGVRRSTTILRARNSPRLMKA